VTRILKPTDSPGFDYLVYTKSKESESGRTTIGRRRTGIVIPASPVLSYLNLDQVEKTLSYPDVLAFFPVFLFFSFIFLYFLFHLSLTIDRVEMRDDDHEIMV
jgi:hypothetical protein